jgi:hypothetical protein
MPKKVFKKDQQLKSVPLTVKHRIADVVDDGCGITLICNCGYEAEGLDCTEAGHLIDKHLDEYDR